MAILVISTLPEVVSLDNVLAVSADIAADGPPAGGISHAVIVDGGRVKVFDVWESEEAMNTFVAERLMPGILKSLGTDDPSRVPQAEVQVFEAHGAMGPAQ